MALFPLKYEYLGAVAAHNGSDSSALHNDSAIVSTRRPQCRNANAVSLRQAETKLVKKSSDINALFPDSDPEFDVAQESSEKSLRPGL
jgi:hypothetical protein